MVTNNNSNETTLTFAEDPQWLKQFLNCMETAFQQEALPSIAEMVDLPLEQMDGNVIYLGEVGSVIMALTPILRNGQLFREIILQTRDCIQAAQNGTPQSWDETPDLLGMMIVHLMALDYAVRKFLGSLPPLPQKVVDGILESLRSATKELRPETMNTMRSLLNKQPQSNLVVPDKPGLSLSN